MSELTIRDGSLAIHATMAMDARKRLAELESQETSAKALIASETMDLVLKERNKGNYVSILRIIPEDSPAVRTEVRLTKGDLKVTDKLKLDQLLGTAVDDLFEQVSRVGKIEDLKVLLSSLNERGIDPMDVLDVSIKPSAMAIAKQVGVPFSEVLSPKTGFLDTLCEIGNKLSDQAKVYINAYLDRTLKPIVVLGTKGK